MWSQLKTAILREHHSRFKEDEDLVLYTEPIVKTDSISERKITKLKKCLETHTQKPHKIKDVKQIISLLQELLPYFKKQERVAYKKVYEQMKKEEGSGAGKKNKIKIA